jgi:hypothetical protein
VGLGGSLLHEMVKEKDVNETMSTQLKVYSFLYSRTYKRANSLHLNTAQQGLAADGLNTLVGTQRLLPPLKPKPLACSKTVHFAPCWGQAICQVIS